MRVSYLELYNEELFDLLGATDYDVKMRIFDDASKKVWVQPRSSCHGSVYSLSSLYTVMYGFYVMCSE